MNLRIESKCIGLRKEFIQVVLLWDRRTNAMEKKKLKQDDQLNSSAGIQTNLLIIQNSSFTTPPSK